MRPSHSEYIPSTQALIFLLRHFVRSVAVVPLQAMAPRKRQKLKEQRERDRLRSLERRHKKKPLALQTRAPQKANTPHNVNVKHQHNRVQAWEPKDGSVVDLQHTEERMIIGVNFAVVPGMLAWLSPDLVSTTGAALACRGRDSEQRGASIILTSAASSSGPHKVNYSPASPRPRARSA